MGLVSFVFYICYFFFLAGYLMKMIMWVREAPLPAPPRKAMSLATFLRGLADILLLRRLLRANDSLWLGEWIFHASLFVVFLRHLRYVLEPVPPVITALEVPGIVAAWLLPASLLYVGFMKIFIEKKPYFSSYNFYLLGLLLVLSVSGLIMKYIFRADLADVKHFALGLVSFHAGQIPSSYVFLLHFIVFLILLPGLPAHMVAAPLTMLEARQREDELPDLMHEE
jgi:hypothetical protein